MKKFFTYLLAFAAVATVISCSKSDGPDEPEPQKPNGQNFTETGIQGAEFDMVYVEGGTFRMGATEEQSSENPFEDEYPVHSVTLSDYYIGKYEVTQGLWEAVMGTTVEEQREKAKEENEDGGELKHCFIGDIVPIYYVKWEEVQEFCKKLSQLTGRKYSLPTEAQWEYAARGGSQSKGYKYSGGDKCVEVAWHYGNSAGNIEIVGWRVKYNELGLYDMSGNVYEMCGDWYGPYSDEAQMDPAGPASGSNRVVRGGCYGSEAQRCRVSDRGQTNPGYRADYIGFRVVCIP